MLNVFTLILEDNQINYKMINIIISTQQNAQLLCLNGQ